MDTEQITVSTEVAGLLLADALQRMIIDGTPEMLAAELKKYPGMFELGGELLFPPLPNLACAFVWLRALIESRVMEQTEQEDRVAIFYRVALARILDVIAREGDDQQRERVNRIMMDHLPPAYHKMLRALNGEDGELSH